MQVHKRTRTLRPSTRKTDSPYRVSTDGVSLDDVVRLTILDEGQPGTILGVFEFRGSDISRRASIHFTAEQDNGKWKLRFSEVQPNVVTIG
jgi:hypothetical protein